MSPAAFTVVPTLQMSLIALQGDIRQQHTGQQALPPLKLSCGILQVLLVYIAVEAYGLHHHYQQPTQAGYRGAGFGGYAAVGTPYGGYDVYASFRTEQGDSNNARTGSYGYRDVNGLYRRINYVADANGFRATVDTNEPGTAPGASADAVFNAAPVVPPVPSGRGQIGAPGAYVARAAGPYNAGGYRAYGGYGYNPYGGAPGGYGYTPYGRQGYVASSPALGGYAYGGQPPYGYGATGYAALNSPGVYGTPAGYGSWPSAHRGYRRRR
ncbi:prisilkin-39-like [Dermacentor albipictus]|uniref:prisilkin-39-like n=1 Tax=Dermacentor albipictus TaxID=60249 RepID=UPI0038FC0E8C